MAKKTTKESKKVDATETVKAAPTTGQSGTPIERSYTELNNKERKLLNCFKTSGKREALTIKELADACWKKRVGNERANSWVRNSLRNLIRAGLLEKVDAGTYRQSAKGRAMVKEVEACTIAPPTAAEVTAVQPFDALADVSAVA
jgi:hypothetical protein